MVVLVTGAAGFVGFHVSARLLALGHRVIGLDNVNSYYDPALKRARLSQLRARDGFVFLEDDIARDGAVRDAITAHGVRRVIHLAAQAGVRYSLQEPAAYVASNLTGFVNVLEAARHTHIEHLVFASSSSVYGVNRKVPFSETDKIDKPVSLYGATKAANELMAHSYSHLFNIPATGLRFFTVYGPWGRPDMAYYSFTARILAGEPIDVFNNGELQRDFTYIDDTVEGVVRAMERVPTPVPGSESSAPYRIYNIGNHSPTSLMDFIKTLEQALGREARKVMRPMQPGDVPATFADVDALTRDVGFAPSTPLLVGLQRFVAWYREYHKV